MAFFVGLLTLVMVLDCLILVLLVLIQLPKKEAGAGVAFGGAATDALFGAGSGNVLTKTTKYAAGAFFGMAIVLSVMQSKLYHQAGAEFRHELEQQRGQTPGAPQAAQPNPATPEAPAPTTAPTGMSLLLPPVNPTNAPPSPPQK